MPFLARNGSSGCSHEQYWKELAYCRARSRTSVSGMGSLAWEKPMQPASVSSAISRQFFTLEADGQRAKRIDVRLVSGGSTIFEHFDESRFVQYRVGIRRADQDW